MTIQELFILTNQELKKVVDQIKDDQWLLQMPAGTSREPSTLQQAVNYHTYDDAWVPDVLSGKTKEDVGQAYEPLLTTTNTVSEYDKYNVIAATAVGSLTDLNKTTHLSYGDFPANEYLQHIISFRAFRIYDISKLIGIDSTMSPELVQGLWDEFTPVIDGYRQMGVFPPALQVSEDADLQTKLLALVGRS
jgi:hypothetical protein